MERYVVHQRTDLGLDFFVYSLFKKYNGKTFVSIIK